jgi:hypothetical protein
MTIKAHVLHPLGFDVWIDFANCETGDVMLRNLLRQGWQPLRRAAASEGATALEGALTALGQRVEALQAQVAQLRQAAPAPEASVLGIMQQLADLSARYADLLEATQRQPPARRSPAPSAPRHNDLPERWQRIRQYLAQHGPQRPAAVAAALALPHARDMLRRMAHAGVLTREAESGCYALRPAAVPASPPQADLWEPLGGGRNGTLQATGEEDEAAEEV